MYKDDTSMAIYIYEDCIFLVFAAIYESSVVSINGKIGV